MAVHWTPTAHARPAEWLLRMAESQPPYAVVRRFLLGDSNRPEEWFRVVTWSPTSEGRELVGWVRTFEAACALGWDHKCAYESWRHHMAARRVDAGAMAAQKPPAAELVKFWRENARQAASGGGVRTAPSRQPSARR